MITSALILCWLAVICRMIWGWMHAAIRWMCEIQTRVCPVSLTANSYVLTRICFGRRVLLRWLAVTYRTIWGWIPPSDECARFARTRIIVHTTASQHSNTRWPAWRFRSEPSSQMNVSSFVWLQLISLVVSEGVSYYLLWRFCSESTSLLLRCYPSSASHFSPFNCSLGVVL